MNGHAQAYFVVYSIVALQKKYNFWTTLLQYIFNLIMPQITNYSVNASVLDSEFVSIWPEYIIWFKSHLLRNDAPVSVSCAERKWIHLSLRN